MRHLPSAVGATAAAGVLSVVLAGPALAVCDAYSGTCTEPPGVLPSTLVSTPPAVDDTQVAVTQSSTSPSTLPFTGGELVLISVVGLGAVAGGVVLVAAGRRRAGSTTPSA
jgi:hypothetical protein